MTSKEALEEIECIYEHEESTQHPYDDPIGKKIDYKKEFDILRELVERDTPLKVIRCDDISVISADCPKCKRVVDNGYKGCPFCLQRLDWRRIENDYIMLEETKASSFKSNDVSNLFKDIDIDDLDLSGMDTTYATNMNRIYLRYLECELKKVKDLLKENVK